MLWPVVDRSGLTEDQWSNTLSHITFLHSDASVSSFSQLKKNIIDSSISLRLWAPYPFFMTKFLERVVSILHLERLCHEVFKAGTWCHSHGSSPPSLLGARVPLNPSCYLTSLCFTPFIGKMENTSIYLIRLLWTLHEIRICRVFRTAVSMVISFSPSNSRPSSVCLPSRHSQMATST